MSRRVSEVLLGLVMLVGACVAWSASSPHELSCESSRGVGGGWEDQCGCKGDNSHTCHAESYSQPGRVCEGIFKTCTFPNPAGSGTCKTDGLELCNDPTNCQNGPVPSIYCTIAAVP
jgi:hypothetical protein